jgi:ABC-2 type transport system permease protein
MRNIWTITKKEIKTYMNSPIAYVLISVFLLISGYFFYNMIWWFNSQSMAMMRNPYYAKQLNINRLVFEPIFHNISVILLLIFPLLTMRLFSEEKRSGTEELLYTSPIKNSQIIIGKFLGATSVLIVMLLFLFIYSIFGFIYSKPETIPLLMGYFGLLLMGMAFISIGLFFSSITENQVVAASLTFGMLLLLWVLSWSAQAAGTELKPILTYLSFFEHFKDMPRGVLNLTDVVYYLSVTYFGLFLTQSYLESRRWR